MPEKVNVTKIEREDDEHQEVNRLSDIKPSINADDVENQIAQPDFDIGKFGTDIQNKATRDSRSLFQEDLRNKDLGKTGKDLIEASQNVSKQLQETTDNSILGQIKRMGRKLFKGAENAMASYNTIVDTIDHISAEFDKEISQLEETRAKFKSGVENEYQACADYTILIDVGNKHLEKLKNEDLPQNKAKLDEIEKQLKENPNDFNLQSEQSDLRFANQTICANIRRWESRLQALITAKNVAQQQIGKIFKMVQNHDSALEQMYNCKQNLLPLWNEQIVEQIGLMQEKDAVEKAKSFRKLTEDQIRSSTEELIKISTDIAKESAHPSIDPRVISETNQQMVEASKKLIAISQNNQKLTQQQLKILNEQNANGPLLLSDSEEPQSNIE